MSVERFPLFPLSAHLLPEGRMALRIFEPRYVRMVKEACAENKGFVMCMLNANGDKNANEHIHKIGTYAQVVDFDMLDDGLLGIKVAGSYLVEVSNIEVEHDGLRTGSCKVLEPWQCDLAPQQIAPMDERLKEIFGNYEELAALYESPKFDCPNWVLNRWLELLPVDGSQKQHFLAQRECTSLVNYLSALIA
ncbi:peptidase S16 [Alteromonas marina]|uniref:Peptidase S16 n=1 Tax=Alteromonas marina TaxID=203795 RepID=A0A0B3YGQ4_9ALTE|nr:LON peptidase substrate-binding domain-containing protein [Alteromonas marina]KHT56471.1 peptidase S16 [Alteromonas marina]|tara:strand:- start:120 stop:695 length:576 start_codon:yes stop_codon:yes gene_type:complete